MNFDSQTAIVTGGAQGIGLACAQRIVQGGGRIAIWDVERELSESVATGLGNGSFACFADIGDWDSVQRAMADTLSRSQRVEILINSAGIAGSNAPLSDYPVEEFLQIQRVNVLGTFHVNRAVVPLMRDQNYGRIVNIASVAGKEGNPNASAYSASKAAVMGLTKSLGKELAHLDIAVNCVTPAAARTRIFDQMSEEHIGYMLSKIPRGRFLETREAAEMIAWLASRENSFSTGAVFDLSGGRATY